MPCIDNSPYAALISLQATFTWCTANISQKLGCQFIMSCTSSNNCVEYITMPPINDSLYVALISPQATFTRRTAHMSQDLDHQFITLCTFLNHCAEYITMPPIDDSLYAALLRPQTTFTQCTANISWGKVRPKVLPRTGLDRSLAVIVVIIIIQDQDCTTPKSSKTETDGPVLFG